MSSRRSFSHGQDDNGSVSQSHSAHLPDNAETECLAGNEIDGGDSAFSSEGETKSRPFNERLRKLKQRMNQARQMNRQAVQREGEDRFSGRTFKPSKRPISSATESSAPLCVPGTTQRQASEDKILNESASASVARAQRRIEEQEIQRFAVNDYHNPEGQHRNYLRNLKSLPNRTESTNVMDVSTFDPLLRHVDGTTAAVEEAERERVGARRLAQELHRRIDKCSQKQLRKRLKEELEAETGEVSYINKRNRRFNAKIDRNYDTTEIRQNLERGTAL
jgi:hypothetical protein